LRFQWFESSLMRPCSSNSVSPETISAGGIGKNFIRDNTVTLSPEPLSHTTPSNSPFLRLKLIPLTA